MTDLGKTSLIDRLFAKSNVNAKTGCWDWMGARGHNGYGALKIGGRAGKPKRVHRVSYEIHRGPIPEGMMVCHSCDNRACWNPEHLFLGTHADNMSDRDKKGRQARPRGELDGNSKLSESDVLAIRAAEGVTQQKLAEQFGVHQTTISLIRSGIRWAHADLSHRPLLA